MSPLLGRLRLCGTGHDVSPTSRDHRGTDQATIIDGRYKHSINVGMRQTNRVSVGGVVQKQLGRYLIRLHRFQQPFIDERNSVGHTVPGWDQLGLLRPLRLHPGIPKEATEMTRRRLFLV